MISQLQGLAWGVISLAIIIGLGSVILEKFGNNVGGTSNTTVQYLNTQLGSTGGGLATWVPIIIVLVIAVFFLSYFLGGNVGRQV